VSLSVAVQFASRAPGLPSRAQVRRWALATHAVHAGDADGVVTLRYVDAAEGRALNRDFRGRDYATNVLTFVLATVAEHGRYVADIVICAPVVAREARAQKKALHEHHAHMVVHGMLHAQGLDHEDAAEAAAMEAVERAVLARFRIKDPYATPH